MYVYLIDPDPTPEAPNLEARGLAAILEYAL